MKYADLSLDDKCLYHRYLYYILNEPIISDLHYDVLEKLAKEENSNSKLNTPGSTLEKDYPDYIKDLIKK